MIEALGLTRRFGRTLAVDEVSFSVREGELVALVGDSGSGKTTTLKMINRLVEPDEGEVRIEGRDAATRPPHELRRSIGYVFQGVGLFPHLTVAANIAVPLRLAGWSRERMEARVAGLLELLELEPGLAERLPHALSGGQQQRVGFARALATAPRVLLLDEPFAAIDPLTRDRLQRSFDVLRRRLHLTSVLVTHDVAEAVTLADRVGVMRKGRLVQLGTPGELFGHPADEDVRRLFEMPRRQAQLVAARLGAEA